MLCLISLDKKPHVGNLIVAATNLSFALEIYLKVLLMILGKEGWGHKLLDLYNEIPEEFRESIRSNFDTNAEKDRTIAGAALVDLQGIAS